MHVYGVHTLGHRGCALTKFASNIKDLFGSGGASRTCFLPRPGRTRTTEGNKSWAPA